MRKEAIVVFGVLLIIIISVSMVLAAGSGEGGSENDTNNEGNERNQTQNRTRDQYQERDCEAMNKSVDRIRCRIIQGENYTAPAGNIPEACRNETIKGRCVAFYATIKTCYKLDGRAKDACFKRASGLTKKFSEEAQEGRREKVRNYMVALLYDLEERVEKAYEEGRIDADESAALIDKIVDIKKNILEDGTKEEIRTGLQELKQMWRESLAEVENE